MSVTPEQLSQQLAQFGEMQLSDISARKICDSTVHLILATAFFTGASIGLSKQNQAPRNAYIESLKYLLQTKFGLNARNAKGLIESNSRLYKRYRLIENIYNLGWQSAQSWSKQQYKSAKTLKNLLEKYRDLDMSNLDIEGMKETTGKTISSVENKTPHQIQPKTSTTASRSRTKPSFWLLLILVIISAVIYFSLFPDRLSSDILTRSFIIEDFIPSGIRHFF